MTLLLADVPAETVARFEREAKTRLRVTVSDGYVHVQLTRCALGFSLAASPHIEEPLDEQGAASIEVAKHFQAIWINGICHHVPEPTRWVEES